MLLVLLALACAYFLYRGPIRAWQHTIDLSTFYSASRAWLAGSNPYDAANLSTIFQQAGGTLTPALSINPPETFVLMALLSVLPWALAEGTWTILNVALVALCVGMAMSLAHLNVRSTRGLLFLGFALALAPFQTSISQGQLTIAVTALVLGTFWGQVHDRPWLSGVCLALAISLKPQMAVLFLGLLLFRGRWKAGLWALSTLAIITALGSRQDGDRRRGLAADVAGQPGGPHHGGTLDPTGPTAYLMINLQVLLHLPLMSAPPFVLDVVTYAAVAIVGSMFLLALRQRDDLETQLLLFAGCAVLNLLVVYNRIYGATLLILPMAWALSPVRRHSRVEAAVVAVAIVVFLVPGAAALGGLALPSGAGQLETTLWQYLVLHEIIALVIILAALLVAAVRPRSGATFPVHDRSARTSPASPIDSIERSIVLPKVKPVKPAAIYVRR